LSPQLGILKELVFATGVGVLAAVLLRRLGLPLITVLLIAGALAGPSGFRLVSDVHSVETLAEIGVVLLLFTIGLEFSFGRLRGIWKLAVGGGLLQVGLTVAAVVGVAAARGMPPAHGMFFGFVISLSSTAIVLRALSERREVDAPHGRIIVGTLIFQDLCVVPMMLLIPVLGGKGGDNPYLAAALAIGRAALVVIDTFVVARVMVPRFFKLVDRVRSREVFLLSVLLICLGTAWLTSLAGLSLALGAFLAGVVIADSEYAHRAMTEVLPLRDVFTSLFFISLGLLFDLRVIVERPLAVASLFAAILAGKGLIASVSALVMRFPLRVALLSGFGLAQFGEFGFVLLQVGTRHRLVDDAGLRLLLVAAVLTMVVTPILIRLAPHVAAGAARLKRLERWLGARGTTQIEAAHKELRDHVVVVGYGIAGRVLAHALRECQVQYLVVELNADTVRAAQKAGEPAYYGDFSNDEAIQHAHTERARAVVLLINDPSAAERAVVAVRRQCPKIPVFVRAHYVRDAERMVALGATHAVAEEVESGIEMLVRVLREAGMARNVIDDRVRHARARHGSTRTHTVPRPYLGALSQIGELKVESFLVVEGSFAVGRSAIDLRLRTQTGALVVARRRPDGRVETADPGQPFELQEQIYLIGSGSALSAALVLLDAGPTG
jgi:monovalent cation:H+ antiporter-2, CPA2 family